MNNKNIIMECENLLKDSFLKKIKEQLLNSKYQIIPMNYGEIKITSINALNLDYDLTYDLTELLSGIKIIVLGNIKCLVCVQKNENQIVEGELNFRITKSYVKFNPLTNEIEIDEDIIYETTYFSKY